jgi:Holliday junction resolvase-like predicted endonuclease
MLPKSDLKTPEMVHWVQEIVAPMLREQADILRQELRENGLGRLERGLNAHRDYTDKRFDRLENALFELAEAQKRTEARVEELAEAQKRTEARVEELAEAQKRTEKRVDRLEIALNELAEAQKRTEARVEELAEAQKRTEARVEELAEAQKRTEAHLTQLATTQQGILVRLDRLEHQVGLISNALGIEVEGEAEEIVVYILEQQGYRLLEAPYALAFNGEIDIVLKVETPEGDPVSVLVEAKTRARLKELRRWHSRLQDQVFQQKLVDAGVQKPFLPYFFGLRVYQTVDTEARKLGIGVLDPDGERVAPTLLQ